MRPPKGGGRDGGRERVGRSGCCFVIEVVDVSTFLHACQGDAVTTLTNEKIPFFNAPIYLKNMTQIGKVDEIFGPINEAEFSFYVYCRRDI